MTSCDAPWEERQNAHLRNKIKSLRAQIPFAKADRKDELEKRLEDYEALLAGVKVLPDPAELKPEMCRACNRMKIMVESAAGWIKTVPMEVDGEVKPFWNKG